MTSEGGRLPGANMSIKAREPAQRHMLLVAA